MKQYIVDAFTDKPFSGNPSAVLHTARSQITGQVCWERKRYKHIKRPNAVAIYTARCLKTEEYPSAEKQRW